MVAKNSQKFAQLTDRQISANSVLPWFFCSFLINKPEQAIELHGNPKEKIKMYEKRKIFESDRFRAKPDPGQN